MIFGCNDIDQPGDLDMTEPTTETRKKNKRAHVDPEKGAEWAGAAAEAAVVVDDAKQEAMPPRRFEGPLPCKLTDEEVLALGDEIEAAMVLVDTLEADRKLANDSAKARIKLQVEQVRELRKSRSSRSVERNVEQIERFDLRRCTAQVLRVDTGEIVSERALRSSELQPDLPMTNGENGHAQMDLGDISDPDSLLAAAQRGETDPADASLENDDL